MLLLMLSCCLISIVSGSGIIESSAFTGRIIGGSTALVGQLPYQVSLRTVSYQKHYCGGFIITENWIGSAAHCTIGRSASTNIAVVGTVSRTFDGVTIPLAKFVNHPDYDNKNLRNDISLIRTGKRIEFSTTIQPIHLAPHYVDEGTISVASGWGYTSNPGQAASNLQWIVLKTVSNEECKKKMSASNAGRIFESSLCAEPFDVGGSCMGDSGGPLVGPQNVLIGIISWGVPCSRGFPDVYTRIASYQPWINSVLDF